MCSEQKVMNRVGLPVEGDDFRSLISLSVNSVVVSLRS